MQFKDLFSAQADRYAEFRPRYPRELYLALMPFVKEQQLAWDCACGNGQAALGLSEFFASVIASDASFKQIEKAFQNPKIEYRVCPAERADIGSQSVDLVVVAQALHWFQLDAFFHVLRRVAKEDAVFATWAYALHQSADPALNKILNFFSRELLKPYWQLEPQEILDGYKHLELPFKSLPMPELSLDVMWDLRSLVGYYNSWSASQKYLEKNGRSAVEEIFPELLAAWGDPEEKKKLSCPLFIKAAYVHR